MITVAVTSPFFLALAMTSAADLLITLVTYNGQLACLAMVTARNTASVSTYMKHVKAAMVTTKRSV